MTDYIPFDADTASNLSLLRFHWSMSCAFLSVSLALMLPIYFRFIRRWSTHHPIVQASVVLLVPDAMMVLNFLPLEIMNLHTDHFTSRNYCVASAFQTVSGILASNVGVVYVAYVTYAVIVKQRRKTNIPELILVQLFGWALGISLAGYYLSQDYLGIYRGLYCCTKEKTQLDIVIPVFLVFFLATSGMAFLYYKTFAYIREVQQKAGLLKSRGMASSAAAAEETSPALPQPVPNASGQTTPQAWRSPSPAIPNSSAGHSRRVSGDLGLTTDEKGPYATAFGGVGRGSVEMMPTRETAEGGEPLASPSHAGKDTALDSSPPTPRLATGAVADSAAPSRRASFVPTTSAAIFAASPLVPSATQQNVLVAVPSTPALSRAKSAAAAQSDRKSKDLALSMLLRGLGLIACYYSCWFTVSLLSALALADVHPTSLWPDMVAAWLIKLSPIIDALIVGDLMRRASANRVAAGQGGSSGEKRGRDAAVWESITRGQPTVISTVGPLPDMKRASTIGRPPVHGRGGSGSAAGQPRRLTQTSPLVRPALPPGLSRVPSSQMQAVPAVDLQTLSVDASRPSPALAPAPTASADASVVRIHAAPRDVSHMSAYDNSDDESTTDTQAQAGADTLSDASAAATTQRGVSAGTTPLQVSAPLALAVPFQPAGSPVVEEEDVLRTPGPSAWPLSPVVPAAESDPAVPEESDG